MRSLSSWSSRRWRRLIALLAFAPALVRGVAHLGPRGQPGDVHVVAPPVCEDRYGPVASPPCAAGRLARLGLDRRADDRQERRFRPRSSVRPIVEHRFALGRDRRDDAANRLHFAGGAGPLLADRLGLRLSAGGLAILLLRLHFRAQCNGDNHRRNAVANRNSRSLMASLLWVQEIVICASMPVREASLRGGKKGRNFDTVASYRWTRSRR